mmetsp:Transcript_82570/g.143473  ORF Transcript_82570/g.143473 Transcript_82570/m.143473 type:complete len:225 (-) Transcript_82570:712-1386(-)
MPCRRCAAQQTGCDGACLRTMKGSSLSRSTSCRGAPISSSESCAAFCTTASRSSATNEFKTWMTMASPVGAMHPKAMTASLRAEVLAFSSLERYVIILSTADGLLPRSTNLPKTIRAADTVQLSSTSNNSNREEMVRSFFTLSSSRQKIALLTTARSASCNMRTTARTTVESAGRLNLATAFIAAWRIWDLSSSNLSIKVRTATASPFTAISSNPWTAALRTGQ